MLERRGFFIDGMWEPPPGARDHVLIDPATEAGWAIVSLGGAGDVDRAVAAAVRAFPRWSRTPYAKRLELLDRLLAISHRRMDEMAEVISRELGAPIDFSRREQAPAMVGHLEAFIAAFARMESRELLPNGDTVLREPIGVCGLITPWNWPINQIALKVVPALATGCTCVLKPSEMTPLSAMLYAEMIDEAGFPPGTFNLVGGLGAEVGAALAGHPGVDMVSFTGSTRAGRAVSHAAADTIKRVTLELGGKSANMIFADADLDRAVRQGVAGCYLNSGQSCDAPTRMLVQRPVYERAIEIARDAAEGQAVGLPDQPGDHIGPLVSRRQFEQVQALIESGVQAGARLVAGGPGRPEGRNAGWFVRPTVFADVTDDMRILREEIFGPVLCIQPFDTEEDAIAMANDTDYGLAAYVQTGDMVLAERVAARLRVGVVYVNGQGQAWGSPFGGMKQSGIGREGGRFGLDEYLEIKSLHLPRAAV